MKIRNWRHYFGKVPADFKDMPTGPNLPVEKYKGIISERLSCPLYDTEIYTSEQTDKLHFFRTVKKDRSWSNMYLSGMLPNPQMFLIESIQFHGVTTDLQYGAVRITIGSKIWGTWPLWRLSVRERYFYMEPLVILTQQVFAVDVTWETAVKLGNGLSGKPITQHPVQCLLRGRMVRPVQ